MGSVAQTDRMNRSRAAHGRRRAGGPVPMSHQILTTAAELFSRQGYHAVGIRELADAVGLSTSTLYHYYRTKQEILFAVIDRFMQQLLGELLPADRIRDPAAPVLRPGRPRGP